MYDLYKKVNSSENIDKNIMEELIFMNRFKILFLDMGLCVFNYNNCFRKNNFMTIVQEK